jgi:hypothetical protein
VLLTDVSVWPVAAPQHQGTLEEGFLRAVEVTPSSTCAGSTYPIFEEKGGRSPVAEMSRGKICKRWRPQMPDARESDGAESPCAATLVRIAG